MLLKQAHSPPSTSRRSSSLSPSPAVLYLNYGPYSSYAPHYDSTFANISKDDSDLIYSTYGEDDCDVPSDFRRVSGSVF